MENNLDKYFRDNLNDRKFEFKDEYWLGAQQLLEADERRRKRRGLFWWFGGGLALLGLVSLGWVILSEKGSGEPTTKIVSNSTNPAPATIVTAPILEEKNTTDTGVQTESSEAKAAKIHSGKTLQNHQPPTRKTIDNQQITNKKSRSLFLNTTNNNTQTNQGKTSQSNALNNGAVATEIGSSQLAQQPSTGGQAQNENLTTSVSENTDLGLVRQTTPDFLAILPAFVRGDFGKKDLATSTQPTKIEVAKQRKLHFGLTASGLFRPGIGGGEKTLLGFRIGPAIRLELREGWYIGTGLAYQRRSGSFEATQLATARNYRFGLELDTLLLRPNSLHYLSVPLLLGWQHNQHQLEAGLQLDYLTGVHGESGSYQRQGEPPVKHFTTEETGWIATDGYRRITPTAQVGYRYLLGKNWSVGVSANFTIGGILDSGFEPPLGGFLLKESDKFFIGMQMVYFIN